MLKQLHIENYAIIEHLDIEFASSLNIITGETGAGKSILLGALGLLSGARADISSISEGKKSCIVEGEFEIEGYGMESLFEELDLDYQSVITIRRVIQNSGKSRAFVGDMPVTLPVLRTISECLIDIHSQHQTLLLSNRDFQTKILDSTANNIEFMESYSSIYQNVTRLKGEIKRLEEQQIAREQERDYITYQVEQLSEAAVREGEQDELEGELKILANSEEIAMTLGQVAELLNGDEGGVVSYLKSSNSLISKIEEHYSDATEIAERINSCYLELKDVAEELSDKAMSIESNPRRLEFVEQRLSDIYSLSKKYRVESGDELAQVLSDFENQLLNIENGSQEIESRIKELDKITLKAERLATQISERRVKAAPKFEKHIIESLKTLGMKQPILKVEVNKGRDLTPNGWDNIQYLFTANPMSKPQEVQSVASGGEMSRLMLSIKELVASRLKLPTVIFDEIDTGVSGAVADAMGEIIQKMSEAMQVINITHLPQVASKGDNHYKVSKDERGSRIVKLSRVERVNEIASMLSGAVVTDAAREQAEALLKKGAEI